ncbi:MAG TPA: ATP-binding protein [Flavisolibacter sp.]|nr:ATP-binding protein [Flavisolibacter sp.]
MKIEVENSTKMMRATDAILENLLDAVLVVDITGNIIYANRTAQELFSRNVAELIGQPFGFPIAFHQMQEIEVFKAGKLLTVQMLASNILWDGQDASLLSLRDITEQKKIQQELATQKKLLEKTNEENAQYASLASHDLKEPIRKILIYSDRLLCDQELAERKETYIQKIQTSAQRMKLLIEGIAELSKINHIRHSFSPVDLTSVVQEVVSDLELQIEEKQAKIDIDTLPTIDAIPGEMYQLFLNLISNSLKYAKDDTIPHVRINERETEDGYVCIECADNGIGFDNEMSSKLFQPFKRLHSIEYDGMGIGLTLCQKIVEVHNGQLSAKGTPGHGAIFSILLPKQQEEDIYSGY